jgi:DNA polymerase-1
VVQIPVIKRVISALNLPMFEEPGLEADDFLGIVSELALEERPDTQILIVTNDQDALQLIREGVTVVCPRKGYKEVVRMDRDAVMAKLGIFPEQVPDYKGLAGDNSDNLAGVPGIGPKKAVELLTKFGSVAGIYEQIEAVEPERVRNLLKEHKDTAFLCRDVATILRSGKVNFNFEACAVHDFEEAPALALFEELGFKSAMGRLKHLEKRWEGRRVSEQQASLF